MASLKQQSFGRIDAVQLAVVVVASIAAVAGFKAVFVDWDFAVSAALGGVGAGVVVALAWWRRLLVGETLALSVVALVLVGAVATSGIPTPDAFTTLFDGLLSGWADLLSLAPPVDDTAELRALPFVLAWIGATAGGELLHRTSQPTLPAAGPLVALGVSVLVTAEDRTVALAQGIVIGVGALIIGRAQLIGRTSDDSSVNVERAADDDTQSADTAAQTSGRRTAARLARAAAACVVVGIAAPLVGPRLPLADAYERFDLRDRQVPPWDPLLTSSPLVDVKASLKEVVADDVLFTVEASEPVTRWELAVLGDYSGVVWTVGSATGSDASTEFRPVSSELADPPIDLDVETTAVSARITIDELTGPWLPTAGWTDRLEFVGPESDVESSRLRQDNLRMNLVTGTLAVPSGVAEGLTYDIDIDIPQAPPDAVLETLDVAEVPIEQELDVIPPSIRNLAADILEGTDVGWSRAVAIRDAFVDDGFYDVSPISRPGHSYFRLAEFLLDPQRLVGYEEQYAAAAATIAGIAELPTRVVVGYLIPENRYVGNTAEVRSSDISAWIEINFGANGWVPLDVTPDRSREPTADATGSAIQDVAVPSPPTPPQIPPTPEVFAEDEEPEEDEEDDEEDEEDDEDKALSDSGIGAVTLLGLTGGSVLGLIVVALAAVAVWKALRRRRRRRSDDAALSVALAWRETLDRYAESGAVVPERVTPREAVRAFVATTDLGEHSHDELRNLVSVVQRSAYHPQPPAASEAESAWQYYDNVVDVVHEHRSMAQRVKMAVDPRTLRSRGWRREFDEEAPT